MNTRRAGSVWLVGGVLAIAVLIVATYLLAIKPVYDDKALKQNQAGEADIELIRLKRQLAGLKAQSSNIATYTAQLAAKKAQLPDSYDIPNLLRQLQGSDTSVKVDNNAVGVSTPVKVDGSSTVVGVPITLSAEGKVANLSRFIDRLQDVQSRAVLIASVSLNVGESDDKSTLSVLLTAFCGMNTEKDCMLKAA